MYLKGHYQNAYVTHDLDAGMAIIDERFGKIDWLVFEPDMVLKTAAGDRQSSLRAAVGWAGGLNIELIQPVSGWNDTYMPFLPTDPGDPTPRFHHVAVRRDDEAQMREEIARLGLPLAFEGAVPGLLFIYLDARKYLGHYLEYVWATAEAWEGQGWPKDRPVW